MTGGNYSRAIVRPPGATFAEGITTAGLGTPSLEKALEQHALYCEALERCGLSLTRLPPDDEFPDSTFVEDTAVIAEQNPGVAVIARPGAPSRREETFSVRRALGTFYDRVEEIRAPGTLDGGDVCQAGGHCFTGISERTNAQGARQLEAFLTPHEYGCATIDIRRIPGLLHLKSGLSCVGPKRMVLVAALAELAAFRGYERIIVEPEEAYAANCVWVNDYVLVAEGNPRLEAALAPWDLAVLPLPMSEFQKMDGGLSCLSLRF